MGKKPSPSEVPTQPTPTVPQPPTVAAPTPAVPPPPPEEVQKAQQLTAKLVRACFGLAYRAVKTKCKQKDNCVLFRHCEGIMDIVNELQELGEVAAGRRTVRT